MKKEQTKQLKYLSLRLGKNTRVTFKKKLRCATCDKKFTSIAVKGSAFPLECDDCWGSRFDSVTVFDRDSKIGKIPENLVRDYQLRSVPSKPKPKLTKRELAHAKKVEKRATEWKRKRQAKKVRKAT